MGAIRKERKWTLGVHNISEHQSWDIIIEEEAQGRYLGVTIQKNNSIFKPQWELAKQKARRGAGLVALLARRCNNPLTILKPLWQTYILPAVLYGTEIMDYNKAYIHDLETIQRGLMKTVLRVIPGTATAGCYAITGLLDIKHEIWKRKLAYYQHVERQSEKKWMKLAYWEQLKWGITNKLWDDQGTYSPAVHTVSGEKYWRNELQVLSLELGTPIPRGWTKQNIKSFFEWKRCSDIKKQIPKHSTLGLLGPVHQDHAYDNRTQVWWMKAKIGSIRLQTRNNPYPKCIMCQADNEDMMHMLVCDKYPNTLITDIITIPQSRAYDKWQWLLHFDRSYKVRMKVSQWIHSRWKAREQYIQTSCIRGPRDTGELHERGRPEIGTGESQPEVVDDEGHDDVEPEEHLGEDIFQVRRGPKRKCKMKTRYNQ